MTSLLERDALPPEPAPTRDEVEAVDLSEHPVWAVTMVKDEADVIEGTLQHIAGEGVAGIIVADNGSTDGTRAILDRLSPHQSTEDREPLGCPVVVVDDPEVGYYQSRKMSELAALAAEGYGAEWIVPFDADELWVAPHHVARWLSALPPEVVVVHADLFHHFPSVIDPDELDPFRRIVYRQTTAAGLPKVAFRWRPGAEIHAGNHGVTLPRLRADRHRRATDARLEVRHFPYRSADQFVRKARNGAAAYAATDLPANVGAHWREYGEHYDRGGEGALRAIFEEHFLYTLPSEQGLALDPAPYRRWEVATDGGPNDPEPWGP